MDLTAAITRTIRRLLVGGRVSEGTGDLARLLSALSKEFGRFNEYRMKVLSSVVPSERLPKETFDDLERKYGIEHFLGFTDEQRLSRIIERAQGNECAGPDYLQDQLQQAGFPLYVHANPRLPSQITQYGDTLQYQESVQYGYRVSRINPSTVIGELVVSSPPQKAGRRYLTQYGTLQYGAVQYGTPDPAYTYPQAAAFLIPSDPKLWGRFIFVSPFEDRLATTEEELLAVTTEEFRYLQKLIIRTKYLRDWCILQVKAADSWRMA